MMSVRTSRTLSSCRVSAAKSSSFLIVGHPGARKGSKSIYDVMDTANHVESGQLLSRIKRRPASKADAQEEIELDAQEEIELVTVRSQVEWSGLLARARLPAGISDRRRHSDGAGA